MKSVTPHFFYISDITNSSSFNGKILRKKSMLENFRANVLKGHWPLNRGENHRKALIRTLITGGSLIGGHFIGVQLYLNSCITYDFFT